jgi:hypothetical protein
LAGWTDEEPMDAIPAVAAVEAAERFGAAAANY